MKKLIFCLSVAASVVVHAETNAVPVTAESVIGEALKVIASEGWSADDVADAIKSVRGLYVRDNKTTDGRRRWNGSIVRTVVDTNSCTRTTVYENGRVFVDPYKVVTASDSVKSSNAKLKTILSTNGIPARLAAARKRRLEEINNGVTNVTVTVTAGDSK